MSAMQTKTIRLGMLFCIMNEDIGASVSVLVPSLNEIST